MRKKSALIELESQIHASAPSSTVRGDGNVHPKTGLDNCHIEDLQQRSEAVTEVLRRIMTHPIRPHHFGS